MRFLVFFTILFPLLSLAQEATVKTSPWIVTLNSGPLNGGVYVGGHKTPASFWETNLNVDYQYEKLELGASLGYLKNNSALKNYTALLSLGTFQNLNSKVQLYEKLKAGISFVEEKTALQGVGGSGFHLQAEVGFRYTLKGYFIGMNLTYYHSTFANSYWGEDLFSDLALDFLGPHLTLGTNF